MRITIQETLDGHYYWTLRAPSGQILARSWINYTARRSARRGAHRFMLAVRPAVACALPGE